MASKDDEGNKVYHNCSAYGEKGDITKDFKQGGFVKLFGQERKSIDDNDKEHTNVRILVSKLLKAKEKKQSIQRRKKLSNNRKDKDMSVWCSDLHRLFCYRKIENLI